jgi:uncharacterized membrane protein
MMLIILQIVAIVILLCIGLSVIAWTIRFCFVQYGSIDTMRRDKALSLEQESALLAEINRSRKGQNVR